MAIDLSARPTCRAMPPRWLSPTWWCALLLPVSALLAAPAPQPPTADQSDYIYHARPRDTLIALGNKLLVDPRNWRQLQLRDGIANPRRIQPGRSIRIPYRWLRVSAESAAVTAVHGAVISDGHAVSTGQVLVQGSSIETGPDGSVTLSLADGSMVSLPGSSSLQLEHMQRIDGLGAHDTRLRLQSGRAETSASPQGDFGRFEIVTPVATSAVRGTQFRVSYQTNQQAGTNETLSGAVAVGSVGPPSQVGAKGVTDEVRVAAGFGTRVHQGEPPLPPVALLPAPDLTALPKLNTEASLQLKLPTVVGAQSYRLQLAADGHFQQLVVDAQVARPEFEVAALADGDYWIRARAIDGHGIEGRDAVGQVRQHLRPPMPESLAPGAGATVLGTRARFEWRVRGAAQTHLQLAQDAQFTTLVADRTTAAPPTGADVSGLVLEDLAPGHYFWRVAAVDAQGQAGPWSGALSYEQRLPPAAVVSLAEEHQLLLHWEGAAGDYRVQIARDQAFHEVVSDQSTAAPQLRLHRPRPGFYYARVAAAAPNGAAPEFGPVTAFEIPVPRWARILLPLITATSLL